MDNDKKVLQFPRKTAVFSPTLRSEIKARVDQHIENDERADAVINSTEDAICHWLVSCTRSIAKKLGEKIGSGINSKADSVIDSIGK